MLSADDYRERARRRLPHFLFDYIEGGSYDERTQAENCSRLRAVRLRQRVLRDVSNVQIGANFFGQSAAMPVVLGPVGLTGMYARRGEAQAARAAKAAGVPFCLSTVSVCDLDEVAAAVQTPFWFQLYMVRDRAFMADLLKIAARHCSALVFTIDMPVAATRYRDFRSGMSGAPGLPGALRRMAQIMARPAWAWDVGLRGGPHSLGNLKPVIGARSGMQDFAGWIMRNFDPSVTWSDLAFVREHWKGALILKGILDPDDAQAAADVGADGLVVSNHGGRQLDGVLATADALPAIADRVGDRLTVFADGGVRSGLDVLRMLGLGAKGVFLGRAWVYALAAGGEESLTGFLQSLSRDLHAGMAMTGCADLGVVREALAN
jgi:L-lactate dehydrogenase (cytochrome)